MSITDPQVTAYLETLMPPPSPVLRRLEEEGDAEGIPNLTLAGASALRLLCALHKPRTILEIGSAIGYSAIHMAEAAADAHIVTIELDKARAGRAAVNIREAGFAHRIELITGDALLVMPQLAGPFDMVFIDAAKGKYAQFLQEACRLCRSDGMIVTDNVLFRGYVALPDETIERAHRSSARRIREYNALLTDHPQLDTTILAVGDGLAVSIKR